MSGGLIALEGLDGSGKATQTKLLCGALSRCSEVLPVSFPNYAEASSAPVKMYLNGEFGRSPDDVNAYAASSFFAVDRYASFVRHWRKEYESGVLIVADRYTTSNLVYQLPKLPREQWEEFTGWLLDFEYRKLGLPVPRVTVYLDMEPEISQKLMEKRYGGDEEKRDIHESNLGYLTSCRESAAFAAHRLGWRTVRCMEHGEPLTVEAIHVQILKIVTEELHLHA